MRLSTVDAATQKKLIERWYKAPQTLHPRSGAYAAGRATLKRR